MQTYNFKLKMDLVPKTTWYNNLRKVLPKSEWDRIRKEVYAKSDYKCKICGDSGKLNCDEMWEFDDNNNIQKLKGLQAVCDNCHNIKHIGFVNVQISSGIWPESKLDDLANHFMKVNNVTRREFNQHVNEAFKIWRERSNKKWTIDFGNYKDLINKNPTLKNFF